MPQKTGGKTSVSQWLPYFVCGLIALATLAIYWQATGFGLSNYDDRDYLIDNTHVRRGVTLENLLWAFNIGYAANWHPLTWISHMVDCQIYGLAPGQFHGTGGHHLTNILLHLANSILLFLLLNRLTRLLWPSAFVAILFAVHPLHVESVVWVSERKDVLSTFFMMLALWAYSRYTEHPAKTKYVLVAALFALGLMAKQMLVSLPVLLLLMDYWPFERTRFSRPDGESIRRLIIEKIPLLVLALAASVATIFAQQNAMVTTSDLPISSRMANAVTTYVAYIGNMFWPKNLTFYPLNDAGPTWWQIGAAVTVLLTMSCFAARVRLYVLFGWFWYLLSLVPIIGILQVGVQARADRYTYIPLIGLFVIISFGAYDFLAKISKSSVNSVYAGLVALCVAALGLQAHRQVGYWETSEKLWRHALELIPDYGLAHQMLGIALENQAELLQAEGRVDEAGKTNQEAIQHLQSAIKVEPGAADAHLNLGAALAMENRIEEAAYEFREAIKLKPKDPAMHASLGNALAALRQFDGAVVEYQTALRLSPDEAKTHLNFANVLAEQGKMDEAIAHYSTALKLRPDDADTHFNLAQAFLRQGKRLDAITHLNEALRLRPGDQAIQQQIQTLSGTKN